MKRTWTIIGVTDVALSFKWYQTLLDLPESAPAHDCFGQILDPDGTVLLCLHKWGDHEHRSLISSPDLKPGHGLLLFFVVDNFEIALQRARAAGDQLLDEPHLNPNSQAMEFSLRDLDGYYITISAFGAA
jgi:catechol 2,3-dioxygenase-like lactoylglutathione lyase family enzyme